MVSLSALIMQKVFAKVGKGMATLAVDGWTNVRHQKMVNICLLHAGAGYFMDSTEVDRNSDDSLYEV